MELDDVACFKLWFKFLFNIRVISTTEIHESMYLDAASFVLVLVLVLVRLVLVPVRLAHFQWFLVSEAFAQLNFTFNFVSPLGSVRLFVLVRLLFVHFFMLAALLLIRSNSKKLRICRWLLPTATVGESSSTSTSTTSRGQFRISTMGFKRP